MCRFVVVCTDRSLGNTGAAVTLSKETVDTLEEANALIDKTIAQLEEKYQHRYMVDFMKFIDGVLLFEYRPFSQLGPVMLSVCQIPT